MDETILIIYFPINLFLKYYEIIKKPQKKIIPKSNYLIFQFDNDFISFANLKIYSKANSKVSIFRYNGDDSKDIIGNDTFYFDFSQIYDLEYQNIYLDLDKPKPYLSIKPFISVFNYYENIMFDFQYFDFQTIYSYERYLKWLDNETSFRIYEYNNNPEFGKGQIFIDFFEVINQKMDLYIYREKKYIERSDDNKFENYIKKINIKGEKQIILNETTMDFYDKGLFYFVFSISDFSSNESINFILQIYNPNEYILIDKKQFNLMIAINNNINLYFIIPKGRIHKKYLKYEWYNTNPNMSTSMYINSELDSFGVTNHSYREINNISYLINLVNEGKNESILYFSIKFEDEKLFYHLSNYDILRLNVLAPQMIYILNDISDEGFGETVYFNFYDSHFDKTPRVIFFDSNETLDDLPKKLEDFDEEMKIINGSYTCIKRYTRFVLIGIDVSFKQWQYFTFQKIFPNIFVQTNYSRYFSYSFKNFYINKESFHNSNTKILLYSNKYDTIISNSYIFHNGSNFFFITYDMINKVDEFRFRVNGYYYNTSFEIRYLDNIDIYYYFLEYRLNSINIQINDCSKKTYLISEYKYFNDTILYIKNLDKELNDYYYRNDGLYSNIDDFFNVNISLYEYPFKTKSLFDFIEFKCTAPTEIEINNVNIQKNYIITLNKGTTIPFFIEPYGRSFFRISNVSQIFEENFEIRVNLVTHKSRYLYINLNFSNEIITLNNQNPIKNKKFNKSYDDYIEFKGNNESILIFFSILNDKKIMFINKEEIDSYFKNEYNVFVFPIEYLTENNSFVNIYIENTLIKNKEICYEIKYGNYSEGNFNYDNCITIEGYKHYIISVENKRIISNPNQNISYFVPIYLKNIDGLKYTYNVFTYNTIKSYDIIDLNMKNNYQIYSFENNFLNPEYKGEIIFNFNIDQPQINDGVIYIYKNISEISHQNLTFINYEKNINIYGNNSLYYFNHNMNLSKYYLVFQKKTNIVNKVQIYNPSVPLQIDLKSQSFGHYYGLCYQIFYINNKNYKDTYLHYQFRNLETEIKVKITNLNGTLEFSDYQTNYSNTIKILNNYDYYFIIERKNIDKQLKYLEYLFYSSDDNKVFPLIEKNITKYYPIIFAQKLYFYVNISRLIKNEEEIIKVYQKNPQDEYKIKFFEHEDFDKMINETKEEYSLNKSSCENFNCLYSFMKRNQNDKSALIIANLKDAEFNYNIELLAISKLISTEFKKEFLANETGNYHINRDSFKNAKYIVIKSNQENIISINHKSFVNGKIIYFLDEDILRYNEFIDIKFEEKNQINKFNIEISFINDETNIKYLMHNSKKELNSLLFEINNCNIFNGLINIFNEQEDNIVFYVETIKGDAEIYYLNSINNHTEFLNIFQDLNNYYSYPFESNSKYEFIGFKCKQNSIINITYYDFSSKEILLNYESSIPLFIKSQKEKNYLIGKNSDVFKREFIYKMEIIESKLYRKKVKINFDNKEIILDQNNKYIFDKNGLLINQYLNLTSIYGDVFIVLSIGINTDELEIYNKTQKKVNLNEQYNIFIFPENEINKNFSIIFINNNNFMTKTICYIKNYNNIDYIFTFNNGTCAEIKQNKNVSIIFDRPKQPKIGNIQTYFLLYVDNPIGLDLDYDFYEYSKLDNYQNKALLFDENIKFKLYYFNNQEKGDIYIKFDEKIKENIEIYVYNSKEFIHKNNNGFDGNILIKENIKDLNQYSFSSEDKNLYIILYDDSGREKNNMTIFSSNIFYTVPLNTNIIFYTNKNKRQELNFIIESTMQGYLHLQWVIQNKNSKGKFIIYTKDIEDAIYVSESKDKNSNFIQLNKTNYKIKFEIENEEISNVNSKITVNFNINSIKKITSFIEQSYLIPIITEQTLYFIQKITIYSLNEIIGYNLPKVDYKLEVSYKFFEYDNEEEIIREIDSLQTEKLDGNCKNSICEYSKKKDKEEYKYICLKIDFKPNTQSEYINYNIFKIEKLPQLLTIENSMIINMEKYQKKIFGFKQNSLSFNNSIIIYLNDSKSISIYNYQYMDIPSQKNIYILNEEMVNNNIKFQLYDETNNNYQVNIYYTNDNVKIYNKFLDKRTDISSYRIKIDNCQSNIYYYGIFNKIDKEIIYIENIYGDAKVYYKDFSDVENINSLLNFTESKYIFNYPKIIDNYYDITQIICSENSLLYIIYYPYKDDEIETINFIYGKEYLIYIKNTKQLIIDENSEIYQKEFLFEMRLLLPSNTEKKLKIEFNNQAEILDNKNNILRKSIILSNNEFTFHSLIEDSYVQLKIGLKNYSYTIFNDEKEKEEINADKNHIIFKYPKDDKKVQRKSIKIIIKNYKSFDSGKICMAESFSESEIILSSLNSNCFILKPYEQKNFTTLYPYNNNKLNKKIYIRNLNENENTNIYFYSNFYFEKPENIKFLYFFEKKEIIDDDNNKDLKGFLQENLFIILISCFALLLVLSVIIFIIICKKKKENLQNNDMKIEMRESNLEINAIE